MLYNASLSEAAHLLLEHAAQPPCETVSLFDAPGRVSAAELRAWISIPDFDRSRYDGYALRAADTASARREEPAVLKITGELPAGKPPDVEIIPAAAAKIFTGAPIPPGADTVVKFEDVSSGIGQVSVFSPAKYGDGIIRAGSKLRAGAPILGCGEVINSASAALAAEQGVTELSVFRRARVLIINTGTELAEPGQKRAPAQIYSGNASLLGARLLKMGAKPVNGGVVPDSPAAIAAKISEASERFDAVITSGGASRGDYDFALRAMELAGAEALIRDVAIRPGGGLVVGKKGKTLIMSLPGTSGAAELALLSVCAPAIKRLCGRRDCLPQPVRLKFRGEASAPRDKAKILRGSLLLENGEAWFVPESRQSAGFSCPEDETGMLGIVPPSGCIKPGELIDAFAV